MTTTTATVPTPYSIGSLEGAAVAFIGAFAGAMGVVGESIQHAAIIGIIAAVGVLGYHAYQNS